MKRWISLIIVLCISIISTQSVFADNKSEKNDFEKYNFLVAIGIIEGNQPTSDDYLQTKASRGDMVKYAMKIVGYDTETLSDNYSEFKDVTTDNDIYKYVNLAKKLGYVSGMNDNMFYPNDPISYNDAMVISVSSLGARNIAELKGGYGLGYIDVAKTLGLKHDTIDNMDELTVGDMTKILYAQLFAHTVFTVSGTSERINIDTTENVLEKYHNIEVVHGIVKSVGNSKLNFDYDVNCDDHTITVGSERLHLDKVDMSLLGMNVDAYYKEENGIKTFLFAETNANNITVIESENFISFKNGRIEYDKENISFGIVNKTKSVSISSDVDVVFNGRPLASYKQSDINFDTTSGKIIAIDNDNGGDVDVLIIYQIQNYVVDAVDYANNLIYSKYPKTTIDLSDKEYLICDGNLNKISFELVRAGSVLSVMLAKSNDYCILIPSSTKVNTKITEIQSDNRVVLDNGTVTVIDDCIKEKIDDIKIELNRLITVSYDFQGRVCNIDYSEYEHEYWYAYLMKLKTYGYGSLNPSVKLRVMRLDGTKEEYELAKKVNFDGDRLNTTKAAGIDEIINRLTLVDASNGDRYTNIQMLKIHTDDRGKLIFIDTQNRGENESDSSLKVENCYSDKENKISYAWSNSLTALSSGYPVFTPYFRSFILYAPYVDTESGGVPSDIDSIDEVYFHSSGINTPMNKILYDAPSYSNYEVIDPDAGGAFPVLVYRYKWKPNETDARLIDDKSGIYGDYKKTTVMVDGLSTRLDENGDEVLILSYYGTGRYSILEKKILDPVYSYKRQTDRNGNIILRQLEKGDIVKLAYIDDSIVDIIVLVDHKLKDNSAFYGKTDWAENDEEKGSIECFGPLYAFTDRGIKAWYKTTDGAANYFDGNAAECVFDSSKHINTLNNGVSTVIVYDVKRNIIKEGTTSDLIGIKNDPINPTIVYFTEINSKIGTLFAYTNYR